MFEVEQSVFTTGVFKRCL